MKPLSKILVLRFSSLGDIIMATAMVRVLRAAYPRAQIDMVVRADFLDLIRHNPHLTNKIGLPRGGGFSGLWELKKRLDSENYDLVYDAHRSLRTRLLMPFLNARYKAYYQKHYIRRSLALTFKLPLLDQKRMLERYIEPLNSYAVYYDGRGPELFLDEATQARAVSLMPWQESPKRIVGFIPSAQWPGKRWPISYFRTLLQKLVATTSDQFIVFGGKEDTFCAEIAHGLPGNRVWNAQGKLSLGESSALVQRCEYVVANDTGLMHVADALNVPSVLMLGPTSAESGCIPFHPQARVIEKQMWCRPCSKNGQAPCIRGTRHCLLDLTPDYVLRNVLELRQQLSSKV